jgi:KDO2-lipid IV(A) lauroyltransferase
MSASWTRRQRWKNDLIHAFAVALFALLPRVPASLLRRLGQGLGWLAPRVLARQRRMAEGNLAQVFPRMSSAERKELTRASFRRLGACLGDALVAASGRVLPVLPFAAGGERVLRAAIAEGRGVLLVSAHLGPWEQVASSLVAHGVPLVAVTRGAYDPRLDFVYRRLRGPSGVAAIERGAPGSTARIVRTLRGGGVLGAPMDLASRARSVHGLFLGRPARTVVGPARLALATGAAVVVVTADRAHRLIVERIPREEAGGAFSAMERDRAAHVLTQRLNDVLGERVLAFPEGWVWMHERFVEPSQASRLGSPTQPAWSSPPAST